ncbi:hypothetical protein CPB84DRAFT_1749961 [Gymnopilus junonius]|uniref:Uncharacterized protein n=1 Tax=Gymnopilus junonius TaxID=109634 RepID=A0A9P5NG87_GYMJU|nr:hypothetical protein CPB84DRAFT_1749961 [Gymnopilus junonius]
MDSKLAVLIMRGENVDRQKALTDLSVLSILTMVLNCLFDVFCSSLHVLASSLGAYLPSLPSLRYLISTRGAGTEGNPGVFEVASPNVDFLQITLPLVLDVQLPALRVVLYFPTLSTSRRRASVALFAWLGYSLSFAVIDGFADVVFVWGSLAHLRGFIFAVGG